MNNDLQFILYGLPVLLISLTFHEIAHGFTAYKLGDLTAKEDGRLSLNPLKHIDPLGLIVLIVARIGWAKPVYVNPRNLNNPKKDMAIISLAGPMTNFVLSILFFIPLFAFEIMETPPNIPQNFLFFIRTGFYLNIVLAVFNLLPLPPLDGSKILGSFLPDRLYSKFMRLDSRIGFVLLLLLSITGMLSKILEPMIESVMFLYIYVASKIIGL